eukprot:9472742-Pyramimonas_sp.AAC.2
MPFWQDLAPSIARWGEQEAESLDDKQILQKCKGRNLDEKMLIFRTVIFFLLVGLVSRSGGDSNTALSNRSCDAICFMRACNSAHVVIHVQIEVVGREGGGGKVGVDGNRKFNAPPPGSTGPWTTLSWSKRSSTRAR